MSLRPSPDPLRLEADGLALHQASSFAVAPLTTTEGLERSPLFEVEYIDRAARAEWIRPDVEGDRTVFPLGVVTLHASGVLLEAFGDDRLQRLRRCVDGLQSFRVSPDELRVLPVREMIARPRTLLAPIAAATGHHFDARETARIYLRMAWPFLARPDLDGRAPHVVVRTGRGRREIESILPDLPDEMLAEFPHFPRFDVDELREILIPEPASAHERDRRDQEARAGGAPPPSSSP